MTKAELRKSAKEYYAKRKREINKEYQILFKKFHGDDYKKYRSIMELNRLMKLHALKTRIIGF